MARSAARSAIAMTLLLLLLLPAPAVAIVGPIRSPAKKKIGNIIIKQVATAGASALAKALDSSTTVGQLGGDAADNAGVILYNVTIGKQTVSGTVDIFADFFRVQCPAAAPAKVPCASPACFSVLSLTDDDCAARSMTDCYYVYGLDAADPDSRGYIANEKIILGSGTGTPPISGKVVFGCTTEMKVKQDGVIGLSKGPLSILSQLNISRFSYFLTPDDSSSSGSTSVVLLGNQAVPQTKHSSSTPLLQSSMYKTLYYVNLTGIKVDGESLTGIPVGAFDFAANGSGGVVLSTTISITWLQSDAYNAVKKALVSKILSKPVTSSGTNLEGFDLCYNMKSVAELKFPKITLVFDGVDSPGMDLTTVHYFYKNNVSGLQCLTVMPMPADYPISSILGSMMQAGTNMIYDIGGGQLTFEKGEKGAAAPLLSQVPLMAMVSMLLVWVLLL